MIGSGRPAQLRDGSPGRGKDATLPLLLRRTGEDYRDLPGLLPQLAQHLDLLGCKVCKAIYIDRDPPGPAALRQTLCQPGEAVSGVSSHLSGQGVIGTEDEPQVPELLPLLTVQRLPRLGQVFRRDAILLTLIQGGQQAGQKRRLL